MAKQKKYKFESIEKHQAWLDSQPIQIEYQAEVNPYIDWSLEQIEALGREKGFTLYQDHKDRLFFDTFKWLEEPDLSIKIWLNSALRRF